MHEIAYDIQFKNEAWQRIVVRYGAYFLFQTSDTINRQLLLKICLESLEPFRLLMDYNLVKYLLETIILDNPLDHCIRISPSSDWDRLPASKSLFYSPGGCGLPIGNLTSQLFSNVYLNVLDQSMVALVGQDSYGRYVDDAYVVGTSVAHLRSLIPKVETILEKELGLMLNRNKVAIYSAYRRVEFLGAYLKPFRKYLSNHTLHRINGKLYAIATKPVKRWMPSINSYLGITSHYRGYAIRKRWITGPLVYTFGRCYYKNGILRYTLRARQTKMTGMRDGCIIRKDNSSHKREVSCNMCQDSVDYTEKAVNC